MTLRLPTALALAALVVTSAHATAQQAASSASMQTVTHAPPPAPYQPVDKLVPLPDFIPGLGSLYVDPSTLPAGPFLAYDRQGNLVSSIYMIPLKSMQDQKAFNDLGIAHERADHVDIYYNAGHPGVAEPHYHFVVWYVSRDKADALKQN